AVPRNYQQMLWIWAVSFSLLRPFCIWILGGYRGIWRHFNLNDALLFALGATPPTVIALCVRLGWSGPIGKVGVPLTVIFADYGVFLMLGLSIRSLRRILYEASLHGGKRKRTLLAGSEAGLASALRQVALHPEVFVVGLLTPDVKLHVTRISGFEVLGGPIALPKQLVGGEIDLVLVADADPESIGEMIETAMHFGVEVRLLPSAANVISGDVRVSTTPKPEFALEHPVSVVNETHPDVVDTFRGRSVLITGAGGSIGSELSRQVSRLPVAQVLLLDQDENAIFHIHGELSQDSKTKVIPLVADIRDRDRIWSVFAKYRPQVVLHAAAYKHVPMMEYNCTEAVLNNVMGTRTVAEAAIAFAAERFLMISTDKAVNPSSMMGATKRVAELLVQHLAGRQNGNANLTRCACVRFGNVAGSNGSVVPTFLRQIAMGGPVTVTDAEMTRYFMTIPEAVQLVLQAATLGSNGEVHMLDMGDPVKITTLARRLIEMSGLRPGEDIEIRFIGMRPGEKLQEQLWTDSAVVTPTSFSRVLSIQPPPPTEDFDRYLQSLEAAALTRDDELARKAMMDMPINYVWAQPTGALSNPPASVKPLVMLAPTLLEVAATAKA
ncbi:MAG TPA: nucleoside-diphosphate sugar epimerase/dehydratase, partial [Candidatus Limnocylindrales bacterium]|nr:nucleoside-diphosphate sugar epimerase/dehydratase [Candidatus Limnocylindrales bacterium]